MWYERSRRRILLDFHFPEWEERILAEASPGEVVDCMAAGNADCAIIYAKDHYGNSYYNTRVGHKHKNIGEKDFFGECIRLARERGLAALGYYSISWDIRAAREHPEWRMVTPTGEAPGEGKWPGPCLCFNSDYFDYVKAQTEELVSGYELDGVFYDMLIHNGLVCYCPNCRRLFRERYGEEPPERPTWEEGWRNFLEFRYGNAERFARRLREAIHGIKPELSVHFNYHGAIPQTWSWGQRPVQHAAIGDVSTGEAYPIWHGYIYPSLMARWARGVIPGQSYEVITSRFNRIWDYSTRSAESLKWEALTYLSNGAACFIVDQPQHSGRMDRGVYRAIGAAYGEVKEKQHLFGFAPLKHAAIYFSVRNRDFGCRDDPKEYYQAVCGAFKALLESHLPVDFIFDENASLARLQEYPVALVPNTRALSDEEAEMFARYVEGGGLLIASYETGLADAVGEPRADYALGKVFGAEFAGRSDYHTCYFRMARGRLGKDLEPEVDYLGVGAGCRVKLAGGRGYGVLKQAFFDREPDRYISHGAHHSAGDVIGPAVVVNRFGKGRAVYVPFQLDGAYASGFPVPQHRTLVRNIVRAFGPKPAIEIEAPLTVEVCPTWDESGKRYLVHFVGWQPVRNLNLMGNQPGLMIEEAPCYEARVRCNFDFSGAELYGRKRGLGRRGRVLRFRSERTHEVLVLTV